MNTKGPVIKSIFAKTSNDLYEFFNLIYLLLRQLLTKKLPDYKTFQSKEHFSAKLYSFASNLNQSLQMLNENQANKSNKRKKSKKNQEKIF